MKVFKYSNPKQALFKNGKNEFKIVTERGCTQSLNLNELLIFLSLEDAKNSNEIKEKVLKHNKSIDVSNGQIDSTLNKLLGSDLITFKNKEKEFHKHYSFNARKVLDLIYTDQNHGQIISLGKLELSVTDKCPFNCTYCSNKYPKENKLLTLDDKKRVILDAYDLGADTLTLTGGEPFFNEAAEETIALMDYARKLSYKRKVILTSGFGVIERFDDIRKCGVDEIQISYNKIYRFKWDRIRNEFVEKRIGKISKLQEYGIKVGICCVLTNENINKFDEVVKFCLDHELNSLYFYPVMPTGYAVSNWDDIKLEVVDLENSMVRIKDLKEIFRDKMYISAPQSFLVKESQKQICEGGLYMIYITETGFAASCACSQVSSYNVGQHSLEWIWKKSDYFEPFRENDHIKTECSLCDKNKYCISSCIVREKTALDKRLKCGYAGCLLGK